MKAATLLIEGIVKGILFQSTPPVKAATQGITQIITAIAISIHAAREGGDDAFGRFRPALAFQSTPPVKAATA